MGEYKKLWWTLIAILAITFGILGYFGKEVYRVAPPIPDQVVSAQGDLIMTNETILNGQTAYQSVGGMQLGSIWGHGAYQAPDWTADWLRRELLAWLDLTAQQLYGVSYDELDARDQSMLRHDLEVEYRTNTYDVARDVLVLSDTRYAAIKQTADYYIRLFGNDPAFEQTRHNFAMKNDTLPSERRRIELTHFFFWTSWAAATERPDSNVTYTNNWPHEPLISNTPSAENLI